MNALRQAGFQLDPPAVAAMIDVRLEERGMQVVTGQGPGRVAMGCSLWQLLVLGKWQCTDGATARSYCWQGTCRAPCVEDWRCCGVLLSDCVEGLSLDMAQFFSLTEILAACYATHFSDGSFPHTSFLHVFFSMFLHTLPAQHTPPFLLTFLPCRNLTQTTASR